MTIYAIDDIDDAIDATRSFLWPFDRWRWAKLALVVLFIGGIGGMNPLQFGGGTPGTDVTETSGNLGTPESFASIGGSELALIAALTALLTLIGLLFLLISSIMEFVFVESLRRETVKIRRYWSTQWRHGLQLFVFRLLLGILTFGILGLLAVGVAAPVLFGDGGFSLGLILIAVSLGILMTVLSGLFHGFTTMFVVPIMMSENRGVLAGWRRLWPTITDQWKQYAAYAVMSVILQLVGGIVASIATAIGAPLLAIPLGILGVIGAGLMALSHIVGWIVIGIAAIVFVLALIMLVLLTAVPVQTYLRYYALLVLGDTNEAFDLIADQRRQIRE